MPDSLVVQIMRQNKLALLAREQVQMAAMAQRWLAIEQALDAQISALAEEFARLARDGVTPSQSKLFQMDRYQSLLKQLYVELDSYTGYADSLITSQQRAYANLAIAHSNAALDASGVGAGFDKLPIEAVENAVGITGDGSPLRSLLVDTWPDAAQAMTNELIRSTALGVNPRETALRMKNGTTRSLNRMLNIARSEQLRVYKEVSRSAYKASGVVTSYRRLATKDQRSCSGCLAADGLEYSLDVPFESHPSCRCTLVPVVNGVSPEWEKAPEWFARQAESVQKEILGPGRFKLYKDGIDFKDFATVRTNETWGDAIVPTTLRELSAQ